MTDLLNKMVPPRMRRPQIMRGGIIQIQVTRACDLACTHCTQGSNLAGKPAMMTVDQFDKACASLHDYFGVVGMFGGNPCLHPKFGELCAIMRGHFPFVQRGLWSNNLRGNGAHARITFNPRHSNINVHLNSDAAEEFRRDWPESAPFIKGEKEDSLHGSPWVSMIDLGVSEEERIERISKCDINQFWSAAIGVFRGELRAYFCEVAYSQSALHQDNPSFAKTGQPIPDTGLAVEPGWWKRPIEDFADQINTHCHHCGIPMRRQGLPAVTADHEEFSETHRWISRNKIKDRPSQLVTINGPIVSQNRPATEYLPGTTPRAAVKG